MNNELLNQKIQELQSLASQEGISLDDALLELKKPTASGTESGNAWSRIQMARAQNRPKPQDFVQAIFPDLIEFHGDRLCGDDQSLLGGVAIFENIPVTVISTRKGTDLKSNLEYRFGMPSPEGYRKALRLMHQAEKFHRPVILFVDTPGAFPGVESEDHGISAAIADNLYSMSGLKTPTIAIITGEGGSGGALALLVTDRVGILENAFLSVISPEGCASILFKDANKAPQAAENLRLQSEFLRAQGIVDQVFSETTQFSGDWVELKTQIRSWLLDQLQFMMRMPTTTLLEERFNRLRGYGAFQA